METPEPKNDELDDVGHLIQGAGRRSMPSNETRERLFRGARAEWQRVSFRRRVVRVFGWVAPAGVLAAGAFLLLRPPHESTPEPSPVAHVAQSSGEPAFVVQAGAEQALSDESPVFAGRLVATHEGWLRLATTNGADVRLDRHTLVMLDGAEGIELIQGRVYIETREGRPVVVSTSIGTVTDVGTRFEVYVSDHRLQLAVREGAVEMVTPLASDRAAVTGFSGDVLTTTGSGIERSARLTFDPTWAWIHSVAPGYSSGSAHTVRAILETIARDLGMALRFAGVEPETVANEAHIDGNLDKLAPRAALDVVLAASGMVARSTDAGVLLVDTK